MSELVESLTVDETAVWMREQLTDQLGDAIPDDLREFADRVARRSICRLQGVGWWTAKNSAGGVSLWMSARFRWVYHNEILHLLHTPSFLTDDEADELADQISRRVRIN
jgi:hypothetical protein